MSVMVDSSIDRVLDLLRRGGKYSPVEISRNCHAQNNTVIKDLKFLRDAGHKIEKERIVNKDGTHYYLYWLVKPEPKQEAPWHFKTIEEKIVTLKKIVADYPVDHPQAAIIREDIKHLEALCDTQAKIR